jgi:hypothetical protein
VSSMVAGIGYHGAVFVPLVATLVNPCHRLRQAATPWPRGCGGASVAGAQVSGR